MKTTITRRVMMLAHAIRREAAAPYNLKITTGRVTVAL